MKYQSGLTLIELMIAILIGLIVMAAATQLFISGSLSYRLQQSLGELQDNGNFGINYVVKDIRQANLDADQAVVNDRNRYGGIVLTSLLSYSNLTEADKPLQSANLPFYLTDPKTVADHLLTHSNGQAGWSAPSQAQGLSSDQLTIQYKPVLAGSLDCEGSSITQQEINQGVFIIQRYFLRREGQDLALVCDAGRYQSAWPTAQLPNSIRGYGGNGVVILRHVDHFRVLLGIQDGLALKYVSIQDYMGSANQLSVNQAPRARIVSIQLGILMRSSASITSNSTMPDKFWVLDQQIQLTPEALKQKYLRDVITQTIALRNGYGLMEYPL